MDDHSLERLDFLRVRELVAGFAMSGLGRGLAMTVHPVSRVALVKRWLGQVTELQTLAEERGLPPLGGICDVRDILMRCAPPLRVTVEEMAEVGSTLRGTHGVAAYLRDLPESLPELRHLAERVGDFQSIAERIGQVIDERGQVRDSASPKLGRIRAEIAEAAHQCSGVMDRLLRDTGVRKLLQYPNHTFHGDRMVLPLRAEYRGRLPGIVHRTSDSGATLYVEPAEIVELNNRISNLRSEEVEEINRLLWDLAHEVHINSKEIHRTLEALAVLDLVTAKVRFAKVFDCRCPQINDEGTLSVRGARHPLLLELARQKKNAGEPSFEVVPVDYRLGIDFNLMIVTGPNTGGKTVTLKTIGLLSLMVQAGLPVPVEAGADFGIFSNILIDVGDEQSLQQSLSTFSAHITQLMAMLRHAGPRALLLIDELCAGTDPDEGAAIGRALMDELLRLGCRCVVTTHLGALKGFALVRPGVENACVEFDAETLRPTYRLRLGEPGSSNAIDIAARLGMPRRLVAAARRNVSRKARALHQALESTRFVKRQAEDARAAADRARLEASQARDQADQAKQQLERQQADFNAWAARVAHLRPGDAVRVRNFDRDGKIVRLRIDQHRAEVDVGLYSVEVPLGDVLPPQTPPPPPPPPLPKAAPAPLAPIPRRPRPERARGAAPAPPRNEGGPRPPRAAPPAPRGPRPPAADRPQPNYPALTDEQVAALGAGDSVYVKRFHRVGRVVRIAAAKKVALVDVGMLEVEVPFNGLAGLPPRPEAAPRPRPRPQPETAAPQSAAAVAAGETPATESAAQTPTAPQAPSDAAAEPPPVT